MTTPIKLLLGAVAFIALTFPFFAVGSFFYVVSCHPNVIQEAGQHGWIVFIVNFCGLLLSYGPAVLYVILAAINPRLHDRKGVWIVLIILLSFIGIPLYWYFFVWNEGGYDPYV